MTDEWEPGEGEAVGLTGWPAVAEGDLGDVPRARAIRRYTRDAAKQRAGAGLGTVLSDVYYAVVVVAIGVGVAAGAGGALRKSLPEATYTSGIGVSLPAVVGVLVGALIAMVVSLAGRLGPIGAEGAEAAWWLSLPVDRRGLLRSAALRLPIVGAVVGAVVLAVLTGAVLGDSRMLLAAGTGAVVVSGVVLAMALIQTFGGSRRVGALAGDLLLVAAPATLGVLAWLGVTPEQLPLPTWPVVVAGAVVIGLLGWWMDTRLGNVRERSLRESGSVASQAVGAVVSMDSRELGRALSDGAATSSRRYVSRLRTAVGPASALVTADLVLFRRSVRHQVQVVLAVAVPVLSTVVPQLSSQVLVTVAVLVGGYVAASAAAEGSRRAEMAPILDRLLPLDPTTVRRLRMVIPAAVMTVWVVVVFSTVGQWHGALGEWLALGLTGVPAWAGAAVRAAYRPAPDWGATLASTPFGALPTGVAGVLARGPDIAILGLLPTWIALLLGHATSTLTFVQIGTSFISLLVASSTSTKPFTERMLDAQKEAEEQRKASEASR